MPLLPHQVEGVEWLCKRESKGPHKGGILCDEMGLGKTIQMIELMKLRAVKRTLIVVPKSLVRQWCDEVYKFSEMRALAYDGPKRKFDPDASVVVCPYSVVGDLVEHSWNRIVLDEGHEIRNTHSLIHKNVMQLKGELRWILTGTPVFNRLRDFVSLCEFIGISRTEVQCYFEKIKETYVLRRLKTDTATITFENVELEMYPEERKLYDSVYTSPDEEILEWILRCRQVCAWPQSYYDGIHKKYGGEKMKWTESTAKMDTLLAMIRKHPDEKSIVFTQFRAETQHIRQMLERIGERVFVMDGSTKDRDHVVSEFKSSKNPGAVFVIQIKTGGVGLNLQEATRVYIMGPSWNPATELQAIARAHRNGQTRHVTVKKLMYSESDAVDSEITELQSKKTEICEQVIGEASVKIPETLTVCSNFLIKLGKSNAKGRDIEDDRTDKKEGA
jgi:SNF2 family DNA or RNA helicase